MDKITNILIIGFKLVLSLVASFVFYVIITCSSYIFSNFIILIFDYENYKMVFIDELCGGADTDWPPHLMEILLIFIYSIIILTICSMTIIETKINKNKKRNLICFTVASVSLLAMYISYLDFYLIVDICTRL